MFNVKLVTCLVRPEIGIDNLLQLNFDILELSIYLLETRNDDAYTTLSILVDCSTLSQEITAN